MADQLIAAIHRLITPDSIAKETGRAPGDYEVVYLDDSVLVRAKAYENTRYIQVSFKKIT